MNKFFEKRQRYSIRKLTIGAASVLLGTSLWLCSNNSVVHADTNEAASETTSLVTKSESLDIDNQAANAEESKPAKVQTSKEVEDVQKQTDKSDAAKKVVDTTATSKVDEGKTTNKTNTAKSEVAIKKENTSTAVQANPNKDTYNVTVTLENIAREDGKLNLNPNWPVNRGWVYNFKDQVLTLNDVKDGTRVYSLGLAPTGFKLMNPEVLEQNFRMNGNTAFVNGKDANVTLKYAPISPILVKYVDEDTGEVLSSSSVGANTSTTASLENLEGDPTAIGTSKFLVKAIDIPGYKAVGNTEFIDTYNNVQSLGNVNYQVVTFKYKKVMDNENPKKDNAGSGAQYGEYFGPSWNTIDPADIFTVSGIKGQTYEKDNGDVEAKYQALVDKYQNQGYTYMGIFNYHKNSDFYNWNEGGTSINLIPNKPVTVRYVDEQGNELSAEDILAANPNNPDQTNKGINPAKHWYSAGEWKATPKTINGYTLKATYGATSGKYTPYKYVVTFEYVKDNGDVVTPTPDPTPVPDPTPETPNVTPTPETPQEPENNVTPQPQDPNKPDNNDPENPASTPYSNKVAKNVENNNNSENTTSKNLVNPVEQSENSGRKTLPQTGEEANKAAIFGAIAASLGLIGLVGSKKRRKN